ncbi:FAD-dependent oxidoreductase, partial [Pseudomonas aeruginosa]|nr:FAD-dependent oxidoreductase [Pseudomonas aeruginosa]
LNLLLGEAKALAGLGARIFEYSPALEVQYGERIRVRTAKGSVIDYYRVTNENRLLFGAATPFVERIPGDLKAWNRKLMLKIFP